MDKTPFDRLASAGWPPARLALSLDESLQVLSNWKTRGIPASKCKAIEALSGVSVRLLREDWRDYWPELAKPANVRA